MRPCSRRVEQVERADQAGVDGQDQREVLAGGQRQSVGVGITREADRAGDRGIVDQAARRGLALERNGIGGGQDIDDIRAGEGEVGHARPYRGSRRPEWSASASPS